MAEEGNRCKLPARNPQRPVKDGATLRKWPCAEEEGPVARAWAPGCRFVWVSPEATSRWGDGTVSSLLSEPPVQLEPQNPGGHPELHPVRPARRPDPHCLLVRLRLGQEDGGLLTPALLLAQPVGPPDGRGGGGLRHRLPRPPGTEPGVWGCHGVGRHCAERRRPSVLRPLLQGTALTAQHVIWIKWAPPLERGRMTSISYSGAAPGGASDSAGVTTTSCEPGTRRALETALPGPPLWGGGA